jgi:hypothetical protein
MDLPQTKHYLCRSLPVSHRPRGACGDCHSVLLTKTVNLPVDLIAIWDILIKSQQVHSIKSNITVDRYIKLQSCEKSRPEWSARKFPN